MNRACQKSLWDCDNSSTNSDNIITIDRLRPGETAVVEAVDPSPLEGRLRDLGVIPGTEIRCLHRAPLGDPKAYFIRGAVIALRREDGQYVRAFING